MHYTIKTILLTIWRGGGRFKLSLSLLKKKKKTFLSTFIRILLLILFSFAWLSGDVIRPTKRKKKEKKKCFTFEKHLSRFFSFVCSGIFIMLISSDNLAGSYRCIKIRIKPNQKNSYEIRKRTLNNLNTGAKFSYRLLLTIFEKEKRDRNG